MLRFWVQTLLMKEKENKNEFWEHSDTILEERRDQL